MGKHAKTLRAVFAKPTRANLRWRDIESLFKHLGAAITEGDGSRVHVSLNGIDATFHRPHPSPDTDKGAVDSVREFLAAAGESP